MPSETDGQLFDLSPLAMALLDPATAAIRAINPCGLKLLGKTRASLKDHSPMSLGWTSAANWQKLVSELQNGTRLDRRPFSLAGPADGEIEGVLSAALLRDDGPETIWFCFEDRRAQQRQLKRLAELEPLARHFFFESPDLLSLSDLDGRVLQINPAAAAVLKAQPAELIGRTLWHHCPRAEYPDEQARLYQSIATRGTSAVYEEKPGETLTGSHFHVIAQPVRDQGGRVVAIKKLRRDISERVADEQLDRQRNRMEAIGTLSAGIAHDFNNILGGVILNSELALLDPDLSSDSRGLLEGILAAGQRARDLVGQIQTFSRQDGSSKAALDLIDLLEASLRFLRATIPSSIALDFNCASSEALVEGNAAQLNQLVINLVTNAVHAIAPRPGRISINLRPRRLGPKSPRSGELQSDSYWELSVTDDGCGMPPEVAARVCEPFFTTHAETSGMGLAVVHGIVADLGGSLSFASQPGLGTCVTVLLPRPAGGDQAAAEPEADRPTSILLVEDDPVIRTATAKMLEKLGCVVTSCPEAQQALNLMDERPHAWDLLITDLTLPGIQGLDLTRRIKALRPDMAVIISTGYHAPITEGDLREAGISLVLEKPFTRRELADGLERALGRPVNG